MLRVGDWLSRYRIDALIGAGGMGAVYRAYDPTLERPVAIKVVHTSLDDSRSHSLLLKEARSASALSHPNVCAIYEVGEHAGAPFIAMEYLDGTPLSELVTDRSLSIEEALNYGIQVADALAHSHGRGVFHGDLKARNIIASKDGRIKVVDFGLARRRFSDETTALTTGPVFAGTAYAMAPEQWRGERIDGRTDIWAFGVLLYEMIAGRRPFTQRALPELMSAILQSPPQELPETVGLPLKGIVERCLHKDPAQRYHGGNEVLTALDALLRRTRIEEETPRQSRAITRLIVLPFRMLRPDADYEFLAFSLPEAITNSLSGLASLAVLSSVTAAKYAGAAADLRQMASEAGVDVVLAGTILRNADEVRVVIQLTEAATGTVIWSHTAQLALHDIFRLQDEIVDSIVKSLALPLTWREKQLLKHDVPASAAAYENYLRANQAGAELPKMETARDMYLKCVELDPKYAPAWAQLGRSYRIIAKYWGKEEDVQRAESAFQHALELNPQLNLAHSFYAQFEADSGRAPQAVVRLLQRVRANGNDPNLFVGLVHACRFCGLLKPSIAAHHRARSLDPLIPTSVALSYFMAGDYGRAHDEAATADVPFHAFALALLRKEREALELLRASEKAPEHVFIRDLIICVRALLEGKREESLAAFDRFDGRREPRGEELYFALRILAQLGELTRAVAALAESVECGFICYPALLQDPWLDPLRADRRFSDILGVLEASYQQANRMYIEAGGGEILAIM